MVLFDKKYLLRHMPAMFMTQAEMWRQCDIVSEAIDGDFGEGDEEFLNREVMDD